MLLTVPAAVALAVVPTAIVSGAVPARRLHARPIRCRPPMRSPIFALGLPSFVLIKVFSPAYFAREDTATPMRYADDQPDGQHGRLGRAVLPVPLHGADAAPRHRRGDDAGRLAQRRPALSTLIKPRPFRRRRTAAARAAADPAGQRRSWGRCCGWLADKLAPWFAPEPQRWSTLQRALACWSAPASSSTPAPSLASVCSAGAVERFLRRSGQRPHRRSSAQAPAALPLPQAQAITRAVSRSTTMSPP